MAEDWIPSYSHSKGEKNNSDLEIRVQLVFRDKGYPWFCKHWNGRSAALSHHHPIVSSAWKPSSSHLPGEPQQSPSGNLFCKTASILFLCANPVSRTIFITTVKCFLQQFCVYISVFSAITPWGQGLWLACGDVEQMSVKGINWNKQMNNCHKL